jgi:Domain of unknown function (DUF4149)
LTFATFEPAFAVSKLQRLQAWLAGLWAGLLLGVGAVAAPSLFAALDKVVAGQGAGRIFSVESRISLVVAMLLFMMERRLCRDLPKAMTANLLLVLGALFLTVFGEFALHPLIAAAKAGQPTPLPFGALHGISASMFWAKTLLVLVLAWRVQSR